MRISDWSADVCSSDLTHVEETGHIGAAARKLLVELADEAGEALAYRVRQAGVVDNGREFGARGIDIAGKRVGTGQFGARGGVVGLYRQHPLQRDHRLAIAAGVERRHAELVVE